MKYIKTYEKNIFDDDKKNQLIPNMFIVFQYINYPLGNIYIEENDCLFLGKIKNIPYKMFNNYYIDIDIIDYITDKNNTNTIQPKIFLIKEINIKFTSPSQKECKIEYEELKKDYLIKIMSNKYNL